MNSHSLHMRPFSNGSFNESGSFVEGLSREHSLRLRLLGFIILLVVGTTQLFQVYSFSQLETATRAAIEHEGVLLSDTLQSRILWAAEAGDTAAMQADIDEFVAARQRNDIEINAMLLDGGSSSVVASNSPDNIEQTDSKEHEQLMEALATGTRVIAIEHDVPDDDDDDVEFDMHHPDFYISPGERCLTVTSPLNRAGRDIGGINLKLPLAPLDETLDEIESTLTLATLAAIAFLIVALGFVLHRQIFLSLARLREDMSRIASGDLDRRLPSAGRHHEIGTLAKSFNGMASQLARTQSQLHQYLNPFAIEEAYRRARDDRASPTSEAGAPAASIKPSSATRSTSHNGS